MGQLAVDEKLLSAEGFADVRADVVIAGRGLVAQAMALALAHADLSVVLVGKLPELVAAAPPADFDNRVFAINASSRALLSELRVWAALPAERVQAVSSMRVIAASQQYPASLDFDESDAQASGGDALAWIVESRELQRALGAAVQFHPRITVVNENIESIAEKPYATATTAQIISAKLGIITEPAQAQRLAATRFSWSEHDYGCSALVGTVACELPHHGCAWQWFERSAGYPPGVLALLPLPVISGDSANNSGNFMSLVWSTGDATLLHGADRAVLSQRLDSASQLLLGKLALVGEAALWPLKRSLAQQLVCGSWLVAGDAAHTVHPLAGQGLNLGLQDVQALAATLAAREGFRPLDDARLLGRYARKRESQVQAVAGLTHALWQSHTSDADWLSNPALVATRALGLQGLNSFAALKRELVARAQGF